jgi:hypothetical protein
MGGVIKGGGVSVDANTKEWDIGLGWLMWGVSSLLNYTGV